MYKVHFDENKPLLIATVPSGDNGPNKWSWAVVCTDFSSELGVCRAQGDTETKRGAPSGSIFATRMLFSRGFGVYIFELSTIY
jgi:hypothetical protein